MLCFAALSGCQIVPPPGSTVTAEILSWPVVRDSLGGGYRDLHAAVRAGVSQSDVERGRLVRGDCFEPDPSAQGGRMSVTVTTLLPGSVGPPWPTLVDATTAQGAMRLAVRSIVQPWEHDFAVAEVRRHDQFSDAELAVRRVVELGCRVEA